MHTLLSSYFPIPSCRVTIPSDETSRLRSYDYMALWKFVFLLSLLSSSSSTTTSSSRPGVLDSSLVGVNTVSPRGTYSFKCPYYTVYAFLKRKKTLRMLETYHLANYHVTIFLVLCLFYIFATVAIGGLDGPNRDNRSPQISIWHPYTITSLMVDI